LSSTGLPLGPGQFRNNHCPPLLNPGRRCGPCRFAEFPNIFSISGKIGSAITGGEQRRGNRQIHIRVRVLFHGRVPRGQFAVAFAIGLFRFLPGRKQPMPAKRLVASGFFNQDAENNPGRRGSGLRVIVGQQRTDQFRGKLWRRAGKGSKAAARRRRESVAVVARVNNGFQSSLHLVSFRRNVHFAPSH